MLFLETSVSNWWEPNTPGILDIGDVSVFLGALVAFSTVFMMISRLWMKALRSVIKEEISVATEPIQPTSNGGLSLADVARKTSRLEENVEILKRQSEETKELLVAIMSQSVRSTSRTTKTSRTKKSE